MSIDILISHLASSCKARVIMTSVILWASHHLNEKAAHSLLLVLIIAISCFKSTGTVIITCGTIRGCAIIKINTKFNVVCIQIVPHCGTNRGWGINRGNTVFTMMQWIIICNHNNLYFKYHIMVFSMLHIPMYKLRNWPTVIKAKHLSTWQNMRNIDRLLSHLYSTRDKNIQPIKQRWKSKTFVLACNTYKAWSCVARPLFWCRVLLLVV